MCDFSGGWWFQQCLRANANGKFWESCRPPTRDEGISWNNGRGVRTENFIYAKHTELKIKPSN